MTYAVYAGGINAVEASMLIDRSEKGRYKIFTEAHTRGFLGKLVPWSGTFESYGWMNTQKQEQGKRIYQTELHKSTALWRGEQEIKEYKYNRDGSFKGLFITEHEKPTEKKEPDDKLTRNSTDVLTATLQALELVTLNQGCESEAEVFDGKRRFKMQIRQKSEEMLKPSRYNVYGGKASRCTVEVEPAGGEWHEKPRGWFSIQEQGRKKGMLPTIWFGQLGEGQPAVPVKVMVKTAYGALVMHLIGYDYGDTQLTLKD